MMSTTQNEALLFLAKEAALAAGREILAIYHDPLQDFGIEKKADNSPLTLADKAAHQCILFHLQECTKIPVLSEEGKHLPFETRCIWDRLWIVDPLDGTKEFIKKNGEFTVNIALVEHGKPTLGVVYVPEQDVLYYGIVGEGAWKQVGKEEPLPLPLPQQRDNFVVVASRSHMTPETEAYIEEMRKIHDNVETISSGSSIKICLVAEGTADSYPRFAPTCEWDTAAGDAVARAAGKSVVNVQTGDPLCYNKPDLLNPWFLVEG